ncbi:MAG: nucleotidyltransferase family protein [Hoeflea sp.]|uniref:nucleotidyltransferase family protein n=1 Tax=Hoeflea sp. TaxID=1940281 RepID=UPI0032EF5714
MRIHSAMILAAGLGTRMRPITETLPKPLVEVAGKPLIAYSLEALHEIGITNIVANVHYLAPVLRDWLSRWPLGEVAISDESEELLDSGGGVAKALPLLGSDPFVVMNADTFWCEDPEAERGNLARMVEDFDPARMDILMLTARLDQATGHTGRGDFIIDADRRLSRFTGDGEPVIYAGTLILSPRILKSFSEPRFSLNRCFDSAISQGRLFAAPLTGHWLTVGTPEAIAEAEAAMADYTSGRLS